MNKLDVELLRLLPDSSEQARALLESLASRERGMAATKYQVAKELVKSKGLSFTREDFKEICTVLSQCGAGEFESRGHNRAFKWNYNLVSVANIALGNKELSDLVDRPRERPKMLPKVRITNMSLASALVNDRLPVKSVGIPLADSITIKKNGWEVDVAFKDITAEKCVKLVQVLQNISKAG